MNPFDAAALPPSDPFVAGLLTELLPEIGAVRPQAVPRVLEYIGAHHYDVLRQICTECGITREQWENASR